MTKRFLILFAFALPVMAVLPHAASAPPDAPSVELVLQLSDGSRIIGTPSVDRLKIATLYADLEIRLPLLRSMKFSGTNRVAQVSLQNGDLLNGRLAATEISIKTIFGQVVIPLAKVSKIMVAGQVLYDIEGRWSCDVVDGLGDFHRDGKHVVYTWKTSGYDHTFEGDYIDGQTVSGIQIRRKLSDGTSARMQMTITLHSSDTATTSWRALDSNSDVTKGQTGTNTLKRATSPQP